MRWHLRGERVRTTVAVVASAFLALIVGLLSNLAATYIAPQYASRPNLIYTVLLLTFLLSLPVAIYLALHVNTKDRGPEPERASVAPTNQAPDRSPIASEVSMLPDRPFRRLVGRDSQLDAAMSVFRDPDGERIVAVDGMGGIGKTALAYELVEHLRHEKAVDTVVWQTAPRMSAIMGIAAGLTFDSVVDTVCRHLGATDIPLLGEPGRTESVLRLLRERRVLIVLDNLEAARQPQDELVLRLRQVLGSSRALLTSRIRFKGNVHAIHLTGLESTEAAALARNEAQEKGIGRVLELPESALKQVARATGGSPLAIKLVVGQLGYLPLGVVLDQLAQVTLPVGSSDEDDYVRFYKSIFLPSWQLLSSGAQEVLIGMTHFAPNVGGTLEAIGATTGNEQKELVRHIDALWHLSFVEIADSGRPERIRYLLHPLTQYFVLSDIVKVEPSSVSSADGPGNPSRASSDSADPVP